MLVSLRLGWLRFVLAALLCAAGVMRPIADRWQDASARRSLDPVESRATDRRTELVSAGDRGEDLQGDTPSVLRLVALHTGAPDRGTALATATASAPSDASIDRERARGPPLGSIG